MRIPRLHAPSSVHAPSTGTSTAATEAQPPPATGPRHQPPGYTPAISSARRRNPG